MEALLRIEKLEKSLRRYRALNVGMILTCAAFFICGAGSATKQIQTEKLLITDGTEPLISMEKGKKSQLGEITIFGPKGKGGVTIGADDSGGSIYLFSATHDGSVVVDTDAGGGKITLNNDQGKRAIRMAASGQWGYLATYNDVEKSTAVVPSENK